MSFFNQATGGGNMKKLLAEAEATSDEQRAQEIYASVAKSANSKNIRIEAVSKLTDLDTLTYVADNDVNVDVREAALIRKDIVANSPDEEIRCARCWSYMDKSDDFCRECGATRSSGDFEPEGNIPDPIYDPPPMD